ncbi:hypothetical protein SAMN05216268_10971 [Streptomyces yunnanensis]|uniref:Uncharacterized protein n=3 Tax=Streptomyces TaxID=1883 RepID=A0A2N8P8V0_STRNR|nr:hypothetical protein AOB60_24440 [Streptomyces noursei]SHM19328.1 hypothetical protein SAMN05216268_10971 [Streptomyces yunnanensis]
MEIRCARCGDTDGPFTSDGPDALCEACAGPVPFGRRLLAALTHSGPGYDLPAASETELRSTLAALAERWEQMAKAAPDLGDELFIDEPTPTRLQQVERARAYRKAAADLGEVLRAGRIHMTLMDDVELGQHGSASTAAL